MPTTLAARRRRPAFVRRSPGPGSRWRLAAFARRLAGAWGIVCPLALAQAPPAAPQAPAASEARAEPRFDILEYEVEGNSVLPVAAIERAVTPFLGPNRQLADAEAARAALEKAYQDAGFLTVFVDVPEQRVEDGVVRLRVVEGRVERLSVTGSRYFSQGYIRERVTEFEEGRVPNFNAAQQQLATVNRSEERRVQPVLRAGRLPGTVEIDLKVADELPLSGSVELHNQHADHTDPWRINATGRYDNLFQRDHSLALTAITAPTAPSQSSVLIANYTVPLDGGSSFVAYGVVSNSTVEALGGTTVFGDGVTIGARYVVPLASAEGSSHTFSVGADYKDLKEKVGFGGDSISTPVRYLPFQSSYNGTWSQEARQTQLTVTAVAALRKILERRVECPGTIGPVDQFACKRQGADGGFATLRIDARHTEPVSWGSSVALRLAGQLATDPLVSSEQLSVGGADTVRGYYESETAGDRGLLGSLEWRTPNLAARAGRWFGDAGESAGPIALADLTLLAFVDVARVYTINPAAGQFAHQSLLGTGVGVRVAGRKSFDGGLDIAWPMRPTPSTPDHDLRLHVRMRYRF